MKIYNTAIFINTNDCTKSIFSYTFFVVFFLLQYIIPSIYKMFNWSKNPIFQRIKYRKSLYLSFTKIMSIRYWWQVLALARASGTVPIGYLGNGIDFNPRLCSIRNQHRAIIYILYLLRIPSTFLTRRKKNQTITDDINIYLRKRSQSTATINEKMFFF